MINRCLLGAGVALAVGLSCAQARAQLFPPAPGAFYFGGEGGWTWLESQNPTLNVGPQNGNRVTENFKNDGNVGARAGYQWGPWRFEEEFNYRQNGLSNFTNFFGVSSRNFTGNRTAYAVMTNVLYDFTFGWPITPHIGAGVGAVELVDRVSLNDTLIGRPFLATPRVVGGTISNSNSWQFGYQGIAGLEYNFNPWFALDLDYRYLATTTGSFHTNRSPNSPIGTLTGASGIKYNSGYETNNVVASLIVRFGPPPPPPVVAPPAPPAMAPPPPRNVYLVFFDWDRYNITPEGMAILQQAANQYKAGGRVQLQVTGYTDLSGSAGYNQRLSERRANAVANALVRMGVPRTDMAVSGRGMNDPRVPTALGVREPQNRRVEILFP